MVYCSEFGYKIPTAIIVYDAPTTIDPVGLMLKEKESCEIVSEEHFLSAMRRRKSEVEESADIVDSAVSRWISEYRYAYEASRYIEMICGRPLVNSNSMMQITSGTPVMLLDDPNPPVTFGVKGTHNLDVCSYVNPMFGLEGLDVKPWRRHSAANIAASVQFHPRISVVTSKRSVDRLPADLHMPSVKDTRNGPFTLSFVIAGMGETSLFRLFIMKNQGQSDLRIAQLYSSRMRDKFGLPSDSDDGVSNADASPTMLQLEHSRELSRCGRAYASLIRPSGHRYDARRWQTDVAIMYAKAKILGCNLRIIHEASEHSYIDGAAVETVFPLHTYISLLRANATIEDIIAQVSVIIESEMSYAYAAFEAPDEVALHDDPSKYIVPRPASIGRQSFAGRPPRYISDVSISINSASIRFENVLPMLPCSFIAAMGGPQFGTFTSSHSETSDSRRKDWIDLRLADYHRMTTDLLEKRTAIDLQACGLVDAFTGWMSPHDAIGASLTGLPDATALTDQWSYAICADNLHPVDMLTYLNQMIVSGGEIMIPDFVYISVTRDQDPRALSRADIRGRIVYGVVFLNVRRMIEWAYSFRREYEKSPSFLPIPDSTSLPEYMHECPLGDVPLYSLFVVPRRAFTCGLSSSVVSAHRVYAAHRTLSDLVVNAQKKANGEVVGSGHMISAQFSTTAYLMYYLYEVAINYQTKSSIYSIPTQEQVGGEYHTIAEYHQGLDDLHFDMRHSERYTRHKIRGHTKISRAVLDWLSSMK